MSKDDITAKSKELCDIGGGEDGLKDLLKASFDYGKFPDPVNKYTITGHTAKVYDCAFSGDGNILATGSQDNTVMTTNVVTNLKTSKAVKVNFVMGVALNSNGKMLVSGGMDNAITFTSLQDAMNPTEKKKLVDGHEGYISRLAFVDDQQLLSCSGDGSSILWDVATGKVKTKFLGHTGDCNSISIAADAPKTFATGSTDSTCRVWDMNTGKCVRAFKAVAEVNCVAMFPDGKGVTAGLDNGKIQFFDVGSYGCVGTGAPKNKNARVLSIQTSRSGRWTYAGLSTGQIQLSDTFVPMKWKLINAHETYLCAMAIAKDGSCLATSSYDGTAKTWHGPECKPT